MRLRRSIIAATGALLLVATLAPAAMAGGSSLVMVDEDGRATPASCNAGAPDSAATTVQAGINAVSNGGTVLVCPGVYRETVEIAGRKGLTVRSTRPWKATIQPQPVDFDGPPAIVTIYGSRNITFQWFRVVNRPVVGCDLLEAGILAVGARNVTIRSNRVRTAGDDTLSECGMVTGIMVGYAPFYLTGTSASSIAGLTGDVTTTATVLNNAVRDHMLIGIAATSTESITAGGGDGPTHADIIGNSVRFFHTGEEADDCVPFIPIAGIAKADIRRGRAALSAGLGESGPAAPPVCVAIGIYQGTLSSNSPVEGASGVIRGNRVLSGVNALWDIPATAGIPVATPAHLVGILQLDQDHETGAGTVSDNVVFRNVFGFGLVDAAGAVVEDNRAYDNTLGVGVVDTEGATVRRNDVTDNLLGIFAQDNISTIGPDFVTTDVLFRRNDARDNADDSCVDLTTGGGTQGTANTWVQNQGEVNSSDPDGICGAAAP